jgi:hypothetical protein
VMITYIIGHQRGVLPFTMVGSYYQLMLPAIQILLIITAPGWGFVAAMGKLVSAMTLIIVWVLSVVKCGMIV